MDRHYCQIDPQNSFSVQTTRDELRLKWQFSRRPSELCEAAQAVRLVCRPDVAECLRRQPASLAMSCKNDSQTLNSHIFTRFH